MIGRRMIEELLYVVNELQNRIDMSKAYDEQNLYVIYRGHHFC